MSDSSDSNARVRLDKWLWAARFFKTRTLARQAIEAGRVRVNEQRCKPAREPAPGDILSIVREHQLVEVVVRTLAATRGPAPIARTLYEETEASIARRAEAQVARESSAQLHVGPRPTKRERRHLNRWLDEN